MKIAPAVFIANLARRGLVILFVSIRYLFRWSFYYQCLSAEPEVFGVCKVYTNIDNILPFFIKQIGPNFSTILVYPRCSYLLCRDPFVIRSHSFWSPDRPILTQFYRQVRLSSRRSRAQRRDLAPNWSREETFGALDQLFWALKSVYIDLWPASFLHFGGSRGRIRPENASILNYERVSLYRKCLGTE